MLNFIHFDDARAVKQVLPILFFSFYEQVTFYLFGNRMELFYNDK